MPLYMLDTDIASHAIRGRTPTVDARLSSISPTLLCISAVTRGELIFGLKIKDDAFRLEKLIEAFLRRVKCLSWDDAAATNFATIAADFHRTGTPIGNMDTMIAGHAIATGAILVTNNSRHFKRVPGLLVENWIQGT
jgi:tRNA(fMet)-specific endonuclease VapC